MTAKLSLVLFLGVLAFANAGFYEDVAAFCHWVGENTGWGCDDAASRAAWRAFNSAACGHWLATCDDFCRYRKDDSNGGECKQHHVSGYTDKSTWCYDDYGAGYSCYCN